jgi:hypothetical protein
MIDCCVMYDLNGSMMMMMMMMMVEDAERRQAAADQGEAKSRTVRLKTSASS